MLSGLGDNMQSDSDEWQRWFDSEMPELAKIPGDYQKVLTDFDRLILSSIRGFPLHASLNYTFTSEQSPNELDNDRFEADQVPPRIGVCEGRYNVSAGDQASHGRQIGEACRQREADNHH